MLYRFKIFQQRSEIFDLAGQSRSEQNTIPTRQACLRKLDRSAQLSTSLIICVKIAALNAYMLEMHNNLLKEASLYSKLTDGSPHLVV